MKDGDQSRRCPQDTQAEPARGCHACSARRFAVYAGASHFAPTPLSSPGSRPALELGTAKAQA